MKNGNTAIKLIALNASNTEIKRGGKRQGAGRKPLPPEQKRVAITIRLSREMFDRLCYFSKGSRLSKTTIIERGIGCQFFEDEMPRRKPRQKPCHKWAGENKWAAFNKLAGETVIDA